MINCNWMVNKPTNKPVAELKNLGQKSTSTLAALGVGAGLSTIAAPSAAFEAYSADDPDSMFRVIQEANPVLVTPHNGEFFRFFKGKKGKVKQTT